MSHDSRTALRICPLCEATCGLTLTIEGTTVTGARGDRDDIFSRGFVCPKGASFGAWTATPTGCASPSYAERTGSCGRRPGPRRSTGSPTAYLP